LPFFQGIPKRAVGHRVLDDEHRPFDDDAEIDGAERHDVPRVAREDEAEEADEHRKGNGSGDDQPRTHAAEGEKQADDDNQCPFCEIFGDRTEDVVDERCAVVVGLNPQP
jgi:hypothetical protein